MADHSPEPIFIATEGVFQYLNRSALKLFGASNPDELLGHPVFERIHPDHRIQVESRFDRVEKNRCSLALEEEVYLDMGGNEIPVEVQISPLQFDGMVSSLVYVRNLQIRKKLETEKNHSRELLRSLVDNSRALISVKDQDGGYMMINRHFSTIFDVDPEDMIGKSDLDLFDGDTANRMLQSDRKVLSMGATLEFEEILPGKTGELTYLIQKFPLVDKTGSPFAVCSIATDISSRKKAEEEIWLLNHRLEERVKDRTRELRESLNLNENILRSTVLGIGAYNENGQCVIANPSLMQMATRMDEEALWQNVNSITFWHSAGLSEIARKVIETGESGEKEIQVMLAGSKKRFFINCKLSRFETNGEHHLLLMLQDNTEKRQVEEELRLVASVFHASDEGVVITDSEAVILSVNPAFTEITGYTAEEALGKNPRLLRSDHHDKGFYKQMWDQLTSRGHWQGEIWNRRKNGEAFLEWLTINAVRDPRGNVVRFVSVFHDMTESRKKDDYIRFLAFHDALTELPNRVLLQERLEHGIERALRDRSELAVCFLDLDGFKSVNDSLGHDVGDLLLMEIAARLRAKMKRSVDTIARFGGDEFVILMEESGDIETCSFLAREIISEISRPMVIRGHTIAVGASMGIARYPEDGKSADQIIKRADAAMYVAKGAGKGTFQFYSHESPEGLNENEMFEREFHQALLEGELLLHFQPRVDLGQKPSVGIGALEALVRWQHPGRGLTLPEHFLNRVKNSGLIQTLDDWVLEAVCIQLDQWKGKYSGIPVSVNISPERIGRSSFVDRLAELMARYNISPNQIQIEVTEAGFMNDTRNALVNLERIRSMDIKVAMDNYGSAYSSIAELRHLPIDYIKFHRSMINNAQVDSQDAMVLQGIIDLSKKIGLGVVAEGVESREQSDLLESMGCRLFQGYYYGEPQNTTHIEKTMENLKTGQPGFVKRNQTF